LGPAAPLTTAMIMLPARSLRESGDGVVSSADMNGPDAASATEPTSPALLATDRPRPPPATATVHGTSLCPSS